MAQKNVSKVVFSISREIMQDNKAVDEPYSMIVTLGERVVEKYENGRIPVYGSFMDFFRRIPNGIRMEKVLEEETYIGYYGSSHGAVRDISSDEVSEKVVWRLAMKIKFLASFAGCVTSLERVIETYPPLDIMMDTAAGDEEYWYTSVCQVVKWVLTIEY